MFLEQVSDPVHFELLTSIEAISLHFLYFTLPMSSF